MSSRNHWRLHENASQDDGEAGRSMHKMGPGNWKESVETQGCRKQPERDSDDELESSDCLLEAREARRTSEAAKHRRRKRRVSVFRVAVNAKASRSFGPLWKHVMTAWDGSGREERQSVR